MRIETPSRVWIVALAVTTLACSVVTAAILFLYPRDEWQWELSLSLSLTCGLAFPVTFFMGRKLLENHLLSLELQRLVDRDRLTDVATRDYFFTKMEQTQTSFGTVLMVDIDHFKRINDTFGHLAGDRVIQDVATTLQDHVRYSDVVCRFGGEEFLVFLFGMKSGDALELAERMRRAIAQQRTRLNGAEVRGTVSIGGASKDPMQDVDLAIQKADTALYRAKGAGRNRVMFDTGLPDAIVGRA